MRVILLFMLLATVVTTRAGDASPVVVDTVKQKPLSQYLWIPGTVISRNHAQIAAEVNGRLLWIEEVGNKVAAQGLLARVDDAVINLEAQGLEADIKRLQARISYLQRKVARLRKMSQQKNVAKDLLEEAEMDLAVTSQELEKGRISLQRKQLDQQRTRLQAPFSGVVVERLVQKGEYVHEGEEVLKLVDVDAREIKASVPMSAIPYLSPGKEVTLRYAGTQRQAKLRAVLPVGDEISHSVEIRVTLAEVGWLPGTPVRVQVPVSSEENQLLVSRDALILRGKDAFVFVIDNEGNALRKRVVVGTGQDGLVSVQGTLKVGEQVIVRGAERLQDGEKVRLLNAGS